jgi:co-chaperonin GroES (HSP10)
MARSPVQNTQQKAPPPAAGGENEGFIQRPIGVSAVPSMRGGSAGIIPAQAPRAASQQGHVIASAMREERPNAPKARRYQVMNGGHVVFNGFKSAMPAGKIVESTQYDIEYLRSQGIVLEDIDPPSPPAAPASEEPKDDAMTMTA